MFPPKLLVASLTAPREEMVLGGATNRSEMAFAGPMPGEGDIHGQLQEHWGIDEEWMSPELLRAGRAKEMEHMKMHGVFVSWKTKNAPSTKANRKRSKWVDGLEGDGCRSRILVTEIELGKTKDTQPGTDVDYSAVRRSKEVKTSTTCPMTEGDSTHKLSALVAWDVSRAHVYGMHRPCVYTTLSQGHEQPRKLARQERSMFGTQEGA